MFAFKRNRDRIASLRRRVSSMRRRNLFETLEQRQLLAFNFLPVDINPGTGNSDPQGLTTGLSGVYFSAQDNVADGFRDLYFQNGNTVTPSANPNFVKIANTNVSPSQITRVGNDVFFTNLANDALFRVTETAGVPNAATQITTTGLTGIANLTAFNGTLVFTANDGTDGSLQRVAPGGGTAISVATDATFTTLVAKTSGPVQGVYMSQTTSLGSSIVRFDGVGIDGAFGVINASGAVQAITVVGDRVYFSTGTTSQIDPFTVFPNSPAGTMFAFNTAAAANMQTGAAYLQFAGSENTSSIVAAGTTVYFAKTNNTLWTIPTTATSGAGTQVTPLTGFNTANSLLTAAGTQAFFVANNQLHAMNGTVRTQVTTNATAVAPSNLFAIGNTLYFQGLSSKTPGPSVGRELWSSDGTVAGTNQIFDYINPTTVGATLTANSNPQNFGTFNSLPFMAAVGTQLVDPANTRVSAGNEFWVPQNAFLQLTFDANGLTVTDSDLTGINDNLVVSTSGSSLVLTTTNNSTAFITYNPNGTPLYPSGVVFTNLNRTVTIPFTAITGSTIAINPGAGNDAVNVSGSIPMALSVNGGAGTDSIAMTSGILSLGDGAKTGNLNFDAETISTAGTGIATNAGTTAGTVNYVGTTITSGASITTGNATTSGSVTMTATTLTSSGAINTVGTTTAAPVTFSATNQDITATINAGSSTVTLQPNVANVAISLGDATNVVGTLRLSDVEIDRITSSTLQLGNATSGAITLVGKIDVADTPSIPTLNLITSQNIVDSTAGGGDIFANALSMTAPTGISSTTDGQLGLGVVSLTTNSSGSNGNQFLGEADTLNITSLNAGTGTIRINHGTFNYVANNSVNDATRLNVASVFATTFASATLAMGNFTDTVAGVTLRGGSITGSGTGQLTSTSAYELESGLISAGLGGTVGINKTTTGPAVLSGNNNFTGVADIQNGSLVVLSANALGATGAGQGTTIQSPGTLRLGLSGTYAEPVTSNGGRIVVDSGVAAVLSGPISLSGSSATTLADSSDGALVSQALSGTVTVVNQGGQGGTPIIGGFGGIEINDTFTGSFAFDPANAGPDLVPATNEGLYPLQPSATNAVQLNIDGKQFVTPIGGIAFTNVFNNVTSTLSASTDVLIVRQASVSLPVGWTINSGSPLVSAFFADGAGTAFASDAIPATYNPADWDVALFSLSFSGSVTSPSGTNTNVYIEGAITLPTSTTGLNGSLTLAGQVTGSQGFNSSINSLVISGANSNNFAGASQILSGTTEIRDANALGATGGNTTVAAGATLRLNNASGMTVAEPLVVAGTVNNAVGNNTLSGALSLSGASTWDVDPTTTLTVSGNITGANSLTKVDSGLLTLSGTNNYGATIVDGGSVNVTGATTTTTATINNGATLALPAATSTLNVGAVSVNNGGTLSSTDAAASLVGGPVNIASGGTVSGTGGNLNAAVNGSAGSTITVTGNMSMGNGTATGFNTSGALNVTSSTLTISDSDGAQLAGTTTLSAGTIVAAGGVILAGGTLTGTGTVTAPVNATGGTINSTSGTLNLGNGSAAGLVGGIFNISSGATVVISDSDGSALQNTAVAGTLTAAGGLSFNTGSTLSGTGVVNANVSGNGTFAPGATAGTSVGTMTVNGNFAPAGTLTFQVNPPANNAGVNYDQIAVNGTVNLSAATFSFSGDAGAVAVNQIATLIANDGADATTHVGATPAQFSNVLINGNNYRLFFTGNDGNDVVLIEITPSPIIYVDDSFTQFPGQVVPDADLGTAGNQQGLFGINAFTNFTSVFDPLTSTADANIVVNTGTYNESITVTGTRTLDITGPNLASAVTIGSVASVAGTTILIDGTSALTIGDATNATIAGVVSGTGSLTKVGGGTVTLSNANTYTGATTINAGTLTVSGSLSDSTDVTVTTPGVYNVAFSDTIDGLSGTGSVTLGANTLTVGGNNETTPSFGGVLSGTGGLTKIGTGNQSLTDANTYTGATTINAGTLTVSGTGSLSDSTDVTVTAPGIYNVAVSDTIDGLSGTGSVTLGANTLTVGGNNETTPSFGGVLSGTGGLTKIGTGNQSLTGANTYTGATTINAGTLTVSGTGSLSDSTDVTVTAPGIYNVAVSDTIDGLSGTGSVTLGANTLTVGGNNETTPSFGGVLGGTGGLTKIGTGNQSLTGANTYTGATTINAGTLTVSGTGSLSDSTDVTVTAPGIYNVAVSDTIDGLSGTGSVTLGANTLTVGGNNEIIPSFGGVLSGTGGLTKTGTGNQSLTGANTYTGATTINAGTLTVSGTGSLSDSTDVTVTTPGIYNVAVSDTIDGLSGTGSVTLGANTLTVGGNNETTPSFGGVLSGTGGLTKTGTGNQTLSAANTYTGATTISGGTLTVSGSLADSTDVNVSGGATYGVAASDTIDGLTGTGTVSLGANTLTIGANNEATPSFGGVIGGAGGLTKSGTGNQTLSGANTYTGLTTISAGTLTVSGSLADTSDVNVASGATYNVAANDTIDALDGAGFVTLSGGTLTVGGANDADAAYLGIISGTGGLTKTGSGMQSLGGVNTYTGATSVNDGTLELFISSLTSNTTVAAAGTLSVVDATITGNLTNAGNVNFGGFPDNILNITGNLVSSGDIDFEVTGTAATAGTHYTQIAVTGTVNLAGSTLNITGTPGTVAHNQVVTLIANDLVDATTAAASPLEGAAVAVAGTNYRIFYNGGDGNNVVLVADLVPPVTQSFVRQSPLTSPTNADSLTFRVTFSENVSGVDAADFAVVGTTGTISVSPVSGSIYDVTVSGGNLAGLNGTVDLNIAAAPTVLDLAGNPLPNTQPPIDQTYLVDNFAPVTSSFVRKTPATSPTNADTLVFLVTFSEDVTGVDAADFTVAGTTGLIFVSQVTPSTYDVAISGGNLAGLNGIVDLNLAVAPTIQDLASNALPNTQPAIDETYLVDNIAPVTSSFTRKTPSTSPTNADTLVFLATFDENVTGVDAADFVVVGTTGTISVTQVTGSTYDITISGGNLAGLNGTVDLNLAASPTIQDPAGNALPNTQPAIDQTYLVDNNAPETTSFTRKTPTASITNADTLVFLVTFNEGVTGVDAADFVVAGTTGLVSVTQVTTSTYDVTISGGNLAGLNGVVDLNLAASPTIQDPAGNALPNTQPAVDQTYLVDNMAPVTSSFTRKTPTTSPTNADTLFFLVTFNEDVTGVDDADFTVAGTTGLIFVFQVTPSTYDVAISGGNLAGLNGIVDLNLAASPTILDAAGNALPNTQPAIDETFLVDNTPPVASSFVRQTPATSATNADTLVFRATFDEVVTGVGATDFAVTGTTATITAVTPISGSVYDVTVSGGDLAGLNGTIGLNFNSPTIQDLAGNVLPNTEPATDQTYVVDNNAPSTTSFVRQTPASSPTNADTLIFRATFNEAVMNVGIADFVATGTTGTVTAVSQISPTEYDVTVSGGDLAGLNGTVGLNFNAPTIQDLAGNALPSTEPGTDETYLVDNNPPSTTSFTRKTPNTSPTNADTLVFLATFSDPVVNVGINDFTVAGTTGTVTSVTQVTSSTYDVTISGGDLASLNGTVDLNLAAAPTVQDLAGNALPNTQPATDETYLLDNTSPTATSFLRQTPLTSPTDADTLVFRVTFSEDVFNVGTTDFAVAGGTTATVTGVNAVSPSIYDVTVSGGDLAGFTGTVDLNFNTPTINDLTGNVLTNTNPGTEQTYLLDNTPPAINSFTRKTPATSPTSANTLVFLATFSENVTGVDAADFAVVGTTGTISVTQVTASTYDVTISGGDLASLNGTVDLNLAASPTIIDAVGLALPNTQPAIDEVYVVDNQAPSTSSFTRKNPLTSPTAADTLVFLATFSEPVTGVDAFDFAVAGTTATVTGVTQVTPSTYDVTVSGGDLPNLAGTVNLNVAAIPSIIDLAGNALPNTQPGVDETYVIDNTVPPFVIVDNGDAAYATSGSWTTFNVAAAFNGDVDSAGPNSGNASWTFNLSALGYPTSGQFDVAATWREQANLATNVTYRIYDGSATGTLVQTIVLNQELAPNDFTASGSNWEKLAITPVSIASGTLTVVVDSTGANEFVFADAVRISQFLPPDIEVKVDGVDLADNGNFGFGTSPTPITKTFSIRNLGTADLNLGTITLPSGFSIASPLGATVLAGGASTTFQLRFDATATSSGQLSFTTNDPDANPFNFQVSGFLGAHKVSEIIDDGAPGYSTVGSWSTFNIGGTFDGDISAAAAGSGNVASWSFDLGALGLPTIGSYRVASTWRPQSNLATNVAYRVYNGTNTGTQVGAASVNQELAPNDFVASGANWEYLTGPISINSGRITVELDTATANEFSFADAIRIERFGAPDMQVSVDGVSVSDEGTYSFGTSPTQVTKSFNITNLGVQDLVLGAVTAPSGFTLLSQVQGTVLPIGGSTTLQVRYNAASTTSGQLSIATNDPDNNPFNFQVSGTVGPAVNSAIIDDGDAAYSTSGTWSTFSSGGAFGGDISGGAAGATNKASWTFNLAQLGLPASAPYRVAATWLAQANLATNVSYKFFDGTTLLASSTVNQELAPNDFAASGSNWENILATPITVNSGILVVEVDTTNANEFTFADAVRIERAVPQEIQVSVDGANLPDNGSYGFGTRTTPLTKQFTVNNVGNGTLNLGTITVPAGYTLVSPFGSSSLAPGASTTFQVRFDASVTASGQVSFSTNDAARNPFNFQVSGNAATAITTAIIDDGQAGFTTSGSWTPFNVPAAHLGDITSAANGATNIVTWDFDLAALGLPTVGSYTIAATWPALSNGATNTTFRVLDGTSSGRLLSSTSLDQTLSPNDFSASGSNWENLVASPVFVENGRITVQIDTTLANNFTIADAIRIERSAPPLAEVLVDGAPITDGGNFNFGTHSIPVTKVFTVRNEGVQTLNLGSISLPSGFTLVSQPGSTSLLVGQSTTFKVRYDATSNSSGQLSFVTNDPLRNPFNFQISGTTGSALSAIIDDGDAGYATTGSWTTFSIGAAFAGDISAGAAGATNTATWTFNLSNLNLPTVGGYQVAATWRAQSNLATNATYRVYDGSTSGVLLGTFTVDQTAAPNDFTASGSSWENLAGALQFGSGIVTVQVDTTTANNFTFADAIRIERSAPAQIQVTVDGVDVVDGSTFGFGNRTAPNTRTFTVLNQGTADLTLGTITVPSGFTLVSGFGTSPLPGGASTTFQVRYDAAANASGQLSFTTNDAVANPFNLQLTGFAAAPVTTAIVDDGDAAYSVVGSWNTLSIGAAFGADISAAAQGEPNLARWTFDLNTLGLPTVGVYRVSATWRPQANLATNAAYRVFDGSVVGNVIGSTSKDQTIAPDDFTAGGFAWEDLGTPFLVGSGSITIELSSALANNFVFADAIRIERLSPLQLAGLVGPTVGGGLSDPQSLLAEGLRQWSLIDSRANELNVRLLVDDLPGLALGLASQETGTIWLDDDGAGAGWGSNAVDPLSVVLHELGHLLGYDDLTEEEDADNLMYWEIGQGSQRSLDADKLNAKNDDQSGSIDQFFSGL